VTAAEEGVGDGRIARIATDPLNGLTDGLRPHAVLFTPSGGKWFLCAPALRGQIVGQRDVQVRPDE
jgi:hypothetical protein